MYRFCATLSLLAMLSGCATDPQPLNPPRIEGTGSRIRVGSTFGGKLLRHVRPKYPAEARKRHIQGVVRFTATISKSGEVKDIELLSGDPLLVPAAMKAVKQWLYEPTRLNDEPVEVRTQMDVNFTLSQ